MSNHPHHIHVFGRPSPKPQFIRDMTKRVRPEGERKLNRRAKRQLKKERRG